jgi:putative ABC transport system permease protein
VVTQFAISIALITCTLLVKGQMSYFGDRDLGFEDQGVMAISNHDHRLGSQSGAFTDALRDLTAVVEASVTTGLPTTFSFGDYYKVEGRGDEQFEMDSYLVDDRFVDALGIQVVAGEAFPPGSPSNARSVILNQVAVSQFGLVDPIGKAITYPGAGDFTVIGVVQDFNFRSLQEPIRPFGLMHESSEAYVVPNSTIAVRVQAGRLPETIAAVRTTWEQFAPDQPFEFEFLDQIMAAQYENERRLQALLLIFASLAIIVACLGLLGLAAFVAERRTKEIGIRKSLGATEASLMGLLVRDFTKWVLLANLVAWPVAWFWVNDWLEDYAYQTEVAPWPFLLAGGAALIIAVATVGYQAVRTARADPVNALRYD